MGHIETDETVEISAALADLQAVFDSELAELPAWKREESAIALAALRKALPPLAGHVGASQIRNMIGVFLPTGRGRSPPGQSRSKA